MNFQNRSIKCCDCGTTFAFGADEQGFFASKGFINEPKRCPSCRQARKSGRYINNCYSSPGQILGRAQARLASLLC
ncbi:MAG: zinc-ribbon domain-containing protein [Dehalococcoidia bacterium]|nr:zinc-ribbon domain-containing protein [Dehalococcoidia bacterium]